MKKISILTVFLLCVTSLFAQAPEKFSYQAVVRNTNNQLVASATVGVRVSILQGGVNGTLVYMETLTAVTNANGLVTLQIGGGTAQQGVFADIDWANGLYFLKTEIDPNGGNDYSITSVQQLLSVPYALYSKEAGNGFSGDYNDLTNTPAIPMVPTNVSAFTNDAGYITGYTETQTLADVTAQGNSAGNRQLKNVSDPTDQQDAATKAYIDQLVNNLIGQAQNLQQQLDSLQNVVNTLKGGSAIVDEKSCPSAPTVSDYDGNVYATVQIGEQCWMRENLRTTHYADGTPIPAGIASTSYTSPYYYDYSSSGITLSIRGYLYNWPAAMHGAASSSTNPSCVQGICPMGWHLPSDAEWTELANYVGNQSEYTCGGNSSNIDKALSSESGWLNIANSTSCGVGNDQTMNNATGFSAVPAGYSYGSSFNSSGDRTYFWSSSQVDSSYVYSRSLDYYYADYFTRFLGCFKDSGHSVRCLRDTVSGGGSSAMLPTITTSAVSDVTPTTAKCGGNVTANGGATVSARGVCWSTSQNPTVSDSHTTDGIGTGSFTSSISGLTAGTTYYVRAYVTNSVGTAYGEQRSFTTSAFSCGTYTVTDYDGNTYNTVQIGQQCWMKENLRTTHYSDGTSIPAGGSNASNTEPYYYDNSSHNLPLGTRGYLYNWPAAMHGWYSSNDNPSGVQGICPMGWHLPSNAEWTALTNYVGSQSEYTCGGSSSNIAKALASTVGWDNCSGECYPGDQSVTANNATGFSAVPAGECFHGSFLAAGSSAFFWSSTQSNYSYNAWYRILYTNNTGANVACYYGTDEGMSVRCLRD